MFTQTFSSVERPVNAITLSGLTTLGGVLNGRPCQLRERAKQTRDNHALRFAAAHGFGEFENAPARPAGKPVKRLHHQFFHARRQDVGVKKLPASGSVSSVNAERLTTKSSDPSRTDWRGMQQLRDFIIASFLVSEDLVIVFRSEGTGGVVMDDIGVEAASSSATHVIVLLSLCAVSPASGFPGLHCLQSLAARSSFILQISPDDLGPTVPDGLAPVSRMGCTGRGRFRGRYFAVREKPDFIPAKREKQQFKASKFRFRTGLGPVGQDWQRLLPGQRKLPRPIITRGLGRSRHPHRMEFLFGQENARGLPHTCDLRFAGWWLTGHRFGRAGRSCYKRL